MAERLQFVTSLPPYKLAKDFIQYLDAESFCLGYQTNDFSLVLEPKE